MNNNYDEINKLIKEIDDEIEELDIDTKNCSNVIYASEHMLKMQKFIMLILTGCGAVVGGILNINNFFTNLLFGGLYGFSLSLIPVLVSFVFYSGAKKICQKKILENQADLEIYLELRKEYVDKLCIVNKNEINLSVYNNGADMSVLENKTKKLILKKKK